MLILFRDYSSSTTYVYVHDLSPASALSLPASSYPLVYLSSHVAPPPFRSLPLAFPFPPGPSQSSLHWAVVCLFLGQVRPISAHHKAPPCSHMPVFWENVPSSKPQHAQSVAICHA